MKEICCRKMNAQQRYYKLKKPSWAPPEDLFMYVWTMLYVFIAMSFGYLFYAAAVGIVSWVVTIPFFINLVVNLLYYPVQFWVKSNIWATVIVIAVFATLVWALAMVWSSGVDDVQWVAYLNIPYLIWVTFASVLQIEILRLNGD